MKRRSIALGILAIAALIFYYFNFADRRSRLKVDKGREYYTDVESPPNRELAVLSQEAQFNESINAEVDIEALDALSLVLDEGKFKKENFGQINTRKLIKNATLDFQVNNIDSAKTSIDALVLQMGGYTASDSQNNYSGGPQYEQVVRVPADKLEGFVAAIIRLAKKVKSRNISTKDVTDEFIDIQARLITKRELERNYRDILRQAKSVKDLLEVERELEDVRGAIEVMEGRLQYLNNQVAHSTVSITYYQLIPVLPDIESFGQRLMSSLVFGWDNVLEFIVDLFTAWPMLIIGSITGWFVFRWMRRRKLQPLATNS